MKLTILYRMTGALLGLVLILACSIPGQPGKATTGPTAQVSLSIPAVSPMLQMVLQRAGAANTSRSLQSKAMIFATSGTLEIKDSANNPAGGTPTALNPTSGPGPQQHFTFNLLIGQSYSATVTVYNNQVSSSPLLIGTTSFTVGSYGTTYLSVTPIPQNPVPVSGTTSYSVLPSSIDLLSTGTNGPPFTFMGGEAWFSFTAPSEVAKITLVPDDVSGIFDYFTLSDANGKSGSGALSDSFTNPSASRDAILLTGLTSGKTYYIGMFTTDTLGRSSNSSFKSGTVKVEDASISNPDDQYEPNDSMDSAYAFGSSVWGSGITATALDDDWYSFTPTSEGTASVWAQLGSLTPVLGFGALEVFDSSGNRVGSDWSSNNQGATGRSVFAVSSYLYAWSTYYVHAGFQGRSAVGFGVPLNASYSLNFGTTAPSIPWVLAASFDLGEDQNSSHGWAASGGYEDSSYPVSPPGGNAWSLDGSGSSWAQVSLTVDPNATRYKIVWQNEGVDHSTWVDLYINGNWVKTYYGDNIASGSLNEYVVSNNNQSSSMTIKFSDSYVYDPSTAFKGAYLQVYQQ